MADLDLHDALICPAILSPVSAKTPVGKLRYGAVRREHFVRFCA